MRVPQAVGSFFTSLPLPVRQIRRMEMDLTLPKQWEAGWFGKVLGDAGGAARRGAREGRYRS